MKYLLFYHGWVVWLSDRFIISWNSILLIYYTNLSSSVTSCLYSGNMSSSPGITSSVCGAVLNFEVFVILSAILLPIKSSVSPAVI